ncbi:MAG: MBL fold metallo-hydrolase [Clostridia bacterium]|nr:MBL fold metallo-hydrolase [Clostridia bacterium]
MSYAKEKEKAEEKVRRAKRIVLFIVVILIAALCVFSFFFPVSEWKYYVGKPKVGKRQKDEMRIHFIDVGQGDATLIELPDGKIILIDGGNGKQKTAKTLLRYLNALDVDTIDYLVLTHSDSDHCGGLDKVVKYKKIKYAYIPNTSETLNAEYEQFYTELMDTDCVCEYATRSAQFKNADQELYTLQMIAPHSLSVEGTMDAEVAANMMSAVVWLDYKGVSAVFTGDIPIKSETSLIAEDKLGAFDKKGVKLDSTEILKVAHHGSQYSTSKEFVEYLGVKTAVISCGAFNSYGHPSVEALGVLSDAGVNTYRTDLKGHVIINVSAEGQYTVETVKS